MFLQFVTVFKEWWEKPTNLIAVEFGVVSLSFMIIHNIFMLYFMDLFIFKYRLSFNWLVISQILFVAWHTFSNYFLKDDPTNQIDTTKFKYETVVNYGGPALSVVFLLPFLVQISGSVASNNVFLGIYFSLFLCLYDTLFNRVLISRQVWLQENVPSVKEKLKIHFNGFVFGSLASLCVLPSYVYYYDGISSFRWFCLVISLVSFIGFTVAAFWHTTLEPAKQKFHSSSKPLLLHVNQPSTPIKTPGPNSYSRMPASTRTNGSSRSTFGWTLIRNSFWHKNMLIYLFTNFLQVFSSTFSIIFMDIYLTQLLKQTAVGYRALVAFVSFFSPVVMNIVLSPMVSKRDVYDILKALFAIKIGISLFALAGGRIGLVVSAFMICTRAVVDSVFGLWVYVNQDVDDEYYVKYGTKKASSAFFFVNKIGQAAAPVFGWLMFVISPSSTNINDSNGYIVDDQSLFLRMVLVMLTSGLLQLLAWYNYSLHGGYLKDIKVMASKHRNADFVEMV